MQLGTVDAQVANKYEASRARLAKMADDNFGFQMARGMAAYTEELQGTIKAIGGFVSAAKAKRDIERKDFRDKKATKTGGRSAVADEFADDGEIDFGANMAFTVAEEAKIKYMEVQKAAREAGAALGSPELQASLQKTLETVSALPQKLQEAKEKNESFMHNAKEAIPDYVNAWAEAFDILGAAAKQSLSVISSSIGAVTKALVNGKNAGSAFGKALLGGFGNVLQQMGEGYIKLGSVMALTGDPMGFAVAAGGGALIAVGAAMSAGAAKLGGGGGKGRSARS